jgi:hypothetical protein
VISLQLLLGAAGHPRCSCCSLDTHQTPDDGEYRTNGGYTQASCHEVTADKGAAGYLNVGHLSLLAAAIPYERQLQVHTHHGGG